MSRDGTEDPLADGNGGYNNVHRALAQAFMSRMVMTSDELKTCLAAIMTVNDPDQPTLVGDITAPILTSTLQTVNARLSRYDYEIRATKDQISKSTIYAFVNTTSDPLTQLATTFSAEEIAYVKRVLDCMFDTNNTRTRELMSLSYREACNLAKVSGHGGRRSTLNEARNSDEEQEPAQAKGIRIDEAEAVIRTLIGQSFFHKSVVSGADYYSLAPRGLMELRQYLKETYNEEADPNDPDDEPTIKIKDCEGCKQIVTVGVRCNNRNCIVRFHDACAAQYFRGANECPMCQTEWTGELLVGPRAAHTAQRRTTAGSSRGDGGRVSGGTSRMSQAHNFGDESDDE